RIGAELSWARRTTAALELGQHAEQRPGADHRSAAAGGLPRSDDLSDRCGLQPVGRCAATAPRPGHRTDALIAGKEKPPCRARRLEGCRGLLGPGGIVLDRLREDDLDAAVLRLAHAIGGRNTLVVLAA